MSGAPGAVLVAATIRTTDWILLAVVVVLLAASAGLALAETSLTRTGRVKALSLEDDHRRGSRQLVRLVEHPEAFLNPVLLLVLICQLVAATLVGILADRWFGAIGVVVAAVFEVVVIFVLAEALPKNWAVQNPERAALASAPVIAAIVRFPPVRILSHGLIGLANLLLGPKGRRTTVSESELLAMADVAVEDQVIETEERALIHSIIEFGDTIVREVMRPRPDMVTTEAGRTVSQVLGAAMAAGYSRLPVHDGNVDDIVGIAYAKDLIRAEREGHGGDDVRGFMRKTVFVPETKRVASLIREMQAQKFHQAVVVDEYGGTAGLVTLEDLIEELVGEIVDEYDVEEPPVVDLADGELSVTARLPVDELNELLESDLPEGEWDTVGGLLFNVLGRVPVQGEAVDVDGVHLIAERVQGNRIGRIRVSRVESVPDDSGDGAGVTDDYHSGFVAVVGRPNVGKSTLVNCFLGAKVTITSARPNTTRRAVRGILHRPGSQAVFVDTPGLHRPRSALGRRLNEHVAGALDDVDVVVAVLDATERVGPGDRWVLERAAAASGPQSGSTDGSAPGEPGRLLVVVNKVDAAAEHQVLERLSEAADALQTLGGNGRDGGAEYFPVSAANGRGVDALVDAVLSRLPVGPPYFPDDMVRDSPEAFWVAELVREQLLAHVRDELPHSIACQVTEWEWPRIRVEILVEHESQKAIVIGHGGALLKQVGTAVRRQLPEGAFVELHVSVEKHWQQSEDAIERLGY